MTRVTGWQAFVWLILAGLIFVVLVIALLWLALAIGAFALVLWLHVVALPRLSTRLHVPQLVLEVLLLFGLLGGGWLIGEATGAAIGGVVWVLGVGLPRLVGPRVRRQLQVVRLQVSPAPTAPAPGGGAALQGIACPRCNLVSFDTANCPACGTSLDADAPPRRPLSDS
jgi:hypothetical protein